MDLKISARKFVFILLFVLLFFTCANTGTVIDSYISYSDEIIEIICFIYILRSIQDKFLIRNKRLILIWILFLITGLVGSLLWNGQSLIAIIQDVFFSCSKFLVAYVAAYVYFSHHKCSLQCIVTISKWITVGLCLISIHDLLFKPWYETSDYRYFLNSQKLMFIHPTYLTHAAVTLLLIFTYSMICESKKELPYMFLSSYLILVAMRTKGICFLGIFWVSYIYYFYFKFKNRKIFYLFGALLVLFIGYGTFSDTFLTGGQYYRPRLILLKDSLRIMSEYFPFGTGFASFGSPVAARYYSKMYKNLGYLSYYGMNPEDGQFLSDNFWPTIFGEFGLLGTAIYIYIIALLGKKCINKFNRGEVGSGFIMLMIITYMVITSLAETSFFNPTSMLIFMIFAFCEVKGKDRDTEAIETYA